MERENHDAGDEAAGSADAFFSDKKTMTVSEVAIALEHYTQDRRMRDPSYQPNVLVSKTLEYTNTIATSKNADTVRKIRSVLGEAGFTEVELALVANLQLQTAEEATKLIPSLANRFSEEELNRILLEVDNFRQFE
jgi:DNA-directed RNA polymerase II subunit RPB4